MILAEYSFIFSAMSISMYSRLEQSAFGSFLEKSQCTGFKDMPKLTYLGFLSFATLNMRGGDSLLLSTLDLQQIAFTVIATI